MQKSLVAIIDELLADFNPEDADAIEERVEAALQEHGYLPPVRECFDELVDHNVTSLQAKLDHLVDRYQIVVRELRRHKLYVDSQAFVGNECVTARDNRDGHDHAKAVLASAVSEFDHLIYRLVTFAVERRHELLTAQVN